MKAYAGNRVNLMFNFMDLIYSESHVKTCLTDAYSIKLLNIII